MRVSLHGEVTVEQARAMHDGLRKKPACDQPLAIDTNGLTRCDAAIVQLLCAASRAAVKTRVLAASPAWNAAIKRYGFEDFWPSPIS